MALGQFFGQFSLRAISKRFLKQFSGSLRRRFLRQGDRRRFSRFEQLEDRSLMAVTANLVTGTLTVVLDAANDIASINANGTTQGAGIEVQGTGLALQTFNGVNQIVVQEAGTNTGQTVTFTNGTAGRRLNISGQLSVSGIETVNFSTSQPINALSLNLPATTGGVVNFTAGVNADTIVTTGVQTYANPINLVNNVGLTAGLTGVQLTDVTLGSNTLTINGTGSASTITGIISGSGGITKAGTGTLTFTGTAPNTYRGLTSVQDGLLELNKTAAQAVGGDIFISGSGTLRLLASNQITDNGVVTVSASGIFDYNTTGLVEGIGTLIVNGGTVEGRNATIDVTGNLLLSSGTLRATTGTFNLAGNFNRTGGQFIHNNGRFVFSGAGLQTVTSGGTTFFDVFHPVGGTVRLLDAFNTANTFNHSAGVFDLNGQTATLTNFVLAGGTISSSFLGGRVLSSNPFELQSGTVSGVLAGGVGVNKTTGGTVVLSGVNTYTGPTSITGGTLTLNGSVVSNITADDPGTLNGTGTVFANVTGTGTFSPGVDTPGRMRITGTFAPTGTVEFEVNSPYLPQNAGIDYDQFVVDGGVDLSAATLTAVNTIDTVGPVNNAILTLINNTSGNPTVPGSNPPDNSGIQIGTRFFIGMYNGGDGNNVVLQALTPVITASVDPSSVSEVGGTGLVFTFTRDIPFGPLSIRFSVAGTATNGADYAASSTDPGFTFSGTSGTVSFADGSDTATVILTPIPDTKVEPNETVTLTVLAGTNYRAAISPDNAATGTITDNSITGVVYNDQNGNGIRDYVDLNSNGIRDLGEPTESIIKDVMVYLDLNQDGKYSILEPAAMTNFIGQYTLANVAPGTYIMREISAITAAGFQTQPGTIDRAYQVVVPDGPLGDLDFGYDLTAAKDFGDAPDSYGTTLAANGARHGRITGFGLGLTIDGEINGQPSDDALGDDAETDVGVNPVGIDDEDGVDIQALQVGANEILVGVNTSGRSPGKLQGWVDFDGNGRFDSYEKVVSNQTLTTGVWPITINVPAGTAIGPTYARFRYGYESDLGPNGDSLAGEVEDYQVFVLLETPTASDDVFPRDVDLEEQGLIKPTSVAYRLDVLANDIGGASTFGDALTIIPGSVTSPSPGGGTLAITFDSTLDRQVIRYTPGPGVDGGTEQTFSYQVVDSEGNVSNVANVTINIALSDNIAIDDTFTLAAITGLPTTATGLDAMLNDLTPHPRNDAKARPQIIAVGTVDPGDQSANPVPPPPDNQASATFTQAGTGLTATLTINLADPQKLNFTAQAGFLGTATFKYTIDESPDDPATQSSTRFVTVQVVEGGTQLAGDSQLRAANYLAELSVTVVGADANGEPTNLPTVVREGDIFYLRVTSHDLRDLPPGGAANTRGVQTAFLDVLLNPPPILVNGVATPFRDFAVPVPDPDTNNPMSSITFVNGYGVQQNGQNGVNNAPRAGIFNETGASRSVANGLGTGTFTVYFVKMQALQDTGGQALTIKGDAADALTTNVVIMPDNPAVDPAPVTLTDEQVFLRETTLTILNFGEGEFVNAANSRDVDQDGEVTASDVVSIINDINAQGSRSLIGATPTNHKMIDVNMDSHVSSVDALMVINYINSLTALARRTVSSTTSSSNYSPVYYSPSATETGGVSSTSSSSSSAVLLPDTTTSTATDTQTPVPTGPSSSEPTPSTSTTTATSPTQEEIDAALEKAREDLKKRFKR
jgi:autotransporter-associated beta strand protein